jgi:hypothetical protein
MGQVRDEAHGAWTYRPDHKGAGRHHVLPENYDTKPCPFVSNGTLYGWW